MDDYDKYESFSPGSLRTVLVIEDDKDLSTYLKFLLERAGYHVITSSKGGEGEVLSMRILPDLIILDINLPTVNGYEILHELKNNQATRDIPVIMHSAESSMESYIRCADEGAAAFVGKPLDENELLAKVAQALA